MRTIQASVTTANAQNKDRKNFVH